MFAVLHGFLTISSGCFCQTFHFFSAEQAGTLKFRGGVGSTLTPRLHLCWSIGLTLLEMSTALYAPFTITFDHAARLLKRTCVVAVVEQCAEFLKVSAVCPGLVKHHWDEVLNLLSSLQPTKKEVCPPVHAITGPHFIPGDSDIGLPEF
ncbi:hypothetical protein FOL46_008052 [Perkinsus olseni]|uniref:Uncharacterized protein n=1 Tax=Perkinsus olseni TaxID=32597 RepID=A0A7J6L9T4_PEROL|nr:hypothetical protein FOL46_008052 [Perkinsus olseni]